MKKLALIITATLVTLTSTASLAGGWGDSKWGGSKDHSKWECTYYNDIEYIQEGKKTFFKANASSRKKAGFQAKTKCKLGTKKLQKKYHNYMIKSSGCEEYTCKEIK